MKRMLLWMCALAGLMGSSLCAQELAGAWQGTVHGGGKDLRLIFKISKDAGHLQGSLYSIDQGGQPIKASTVTLDGVNVKFVVDVFSINYEGKVSADGKSIVGTWTQGSNSQPMTLALATKETAWEIPAPAPPPKLMAADADPSFDVATIKPNDSGVTRMQGLTVNGRDFKIRNGSLLDMMQFAYGVQTKQIVNAPDWAEKDRYDVAAVPVEEGAPSPAQLRVMLKKLLADRFGVKFHNEKREMAAFVLTVAKDGPKLAATQLKGPLPGLGMQPDKSGMTIRVVNGTMEDFTGFLQLLVFDRPVVNQTALTDRYDFKVTFLADDSLFNGHPPFPKPADGADSAPSLFDAMPQQLGLKLTAEKTQVDVLVLDHVAKPSAN
ncbi:MAG: TIGR03435 family protein [Acidobacteriota bacterium]